MSTRLGNSGRGTDGPAPPMSEAERRKSAAGSGGDQDRDDADAEPAERGDAKQAEPDRQPGGGRRSESEKPDSGESRWGGGR